MLMMGHNVGRRQLIPPGRSDWITKSFCHEDCLRQVMLNPRHSPKIARAFIYWFIFAGALMFLFTYFVVVCVFFSAYLETQVHFVKQVQ